MTRRLVIAIDCDDVLMPTAQVIIWNQLDVLPDRMAHCKDWSKVFGEIEAYAAR